jgi:methylmalonyl-CoA mutase, N-terminal domain
MEVFVPPSLHRRLRRGAAARGTENLMPRIVDAVKAMVTLGEISDALRAEWGVYRPA